MKRYVKSGVSNTEYGYVFDFNSDNEHDIVSLNVEKINTSLFRGDVYWFGYSFSSDVSSNERTKFIHSLKGLSEQSMDDEDVKKFIELPVEALDRIHKLSSFDFFVYPVSGRSPLVTNMIREVGNWVQRDIHDVSFKLVKSIPSDVEFDWNRFRRDYYSDSKEGLNRFNQMSSYVEEVLLPNISNGDYFSIARDVKAKYRPYIKNFLSFEDDVASLYESKGSDVLVVNDVNTTGSTLYEILRILDKVNSSLNVYIFTLLGKPDVSK